jgi:mono/diheme cytochrome c family protein
MPRFLAALAVFALLASPGRAQTTKTPPPKTVQPPAAKKPTPPAAKAPATKAPVPATKAPAVAVAKLYATGFLPGDRVQNIAFTDIAGKPGTLLTAGGTKGTVIVSRDAECPVTQRYGPRLAEFEKEYGAKGFNFVYLDVTPHTKAEAKADLAKYNLTSRAILDANKVVRTALRLASTAEAFVIDAAGTLRYRGSIDDQYGINVHKDAPTKTWLRDALDKVARGEEPLVTKTEAAGCMLDVDFAAKGTATAITYHNRISRIIQANCQSCHRAGGQAPLPLDNYQQTFERRAVVSFMVKEGRMPPWSAHPGVGEWANDRRLPARDAADINRWISAGAPLGNPKDAPLPRKWAVGWNIGTPDAIVQIPDTFRVPAQGVVSYKYSYAKTDFAEDKWITAMEIKPTANRVVHHVLVFVEEPGRRPPLPGQVQPGQPRPPLPQNGVDGFFAATAPGSTGIVFPEGSGKRLPKGAWLKFQIHYQPNGVEQVDQTQIALKFSDKPLREVESRSANNVRFVIPPQDPRFEVRATYTFRDSGQLTSLFPHMHLRGTAFAFELAYPDGKIVKVLDVPKFDFNWQSYYELKTPIDVPVGARLTATAWYDNSKANPFNPDPTKTVRFGEQTYEEMMIGYFDFIPKRVVAPAAPGGSRR